MPSSTSRAADVKKHAKAAEQGTDPDQEKDAGKPSDGEKEEFHDFATYDHGGVVAFFAASSREELLQAAHGVIDRSSGKDPSTGLEGSALFTQARERREAGASSSSSTSALSSASVAPSTRRTRRKRR